MIETDKLRHQELPGAGLHGQPDFADGLSASVEPAGLAAPASGRSTSCSICLKSLAIHLDLRCGRFGGRRGRARALRRARAAAPAAICGCFWGSHSPQAPGPRRAGRFDSILEGVGGSLDPSDTTRAKMAVAKRAAVSGSTRDSFLTYLQRCEVVRPSFCAHAELEQCGQLPGLQLESGAARRSDGFWRMPTASGTSSKHPLHLGGKRSLLGRRRPACQRGASPLASGAAAPSRCWSPAPAASAEPTHPRKERTPPNRELLRTQPHAGRHAMTLHKEARRTTTNKNSLLLRRWRRRGPVAPARPGHAARGLRRVADGGRRDLLVLDPSASRRASRGARVPLPVLKHGRVAMVAHGFIAQSFPLTKMDASPNLHCTRASRPPTGRSATSRRRATPSSSSSSSRRWACGSSPSSRA